MDMVNEEIDDIRGGGNRLRNVATEPIVNTNGDLPNSQHYRPSRILGSFRKCLREMKGDEK